MKTKPTLRKSRAGIQSEKPKQSKDSQTYRPGQLPCRTGVPTNGTVSCNKSLALTSDDMGGMPRRCRSQCLRGRPGVLTWVLVAEHLLNCLCHDRGTRLFRVGEGVNLEFEGLVVLALDLELSLEFLDQQLEARDVGAEPENVG